MEQRRYAICYIAELHSASLPNSKPAVMKRAPCRLQIGDTADYKSALLYSGNDCLHYVRFSAGIASGCASCDSRNQFGYVVTIPRRHSRVESVCAWRVAASGSFFFFSFFARAPFVFLKSPTL